MPRQRLGQCEVNGICGIVPRLLNRPLVAAFGYMRAIARFVVQLVERGDERDHLRVFVLRVAPCAIARLRRTGNQDALPFAAYLRARTPIERQRGDAARLRFEQRQAKALAVADDAMHVQQAEAVTQRREAALLQILTVDELLRAHPQRLSQIGQIPAGGRVFLHIHQQPRRWLV